MGLRGPCSKIGTDALYNTWRRNLGALWAVLVQLSPALHAVARLVHGTIAELWPYGVALMAELWANLGHGRGHVGGYDC